MHKTPCRRCNPQRIPFHQIPPEEISVRRDHTFRTADGHVTVVERGGIPLYHGHYERVEGKNTKCLTCGASADRQVMSANSARRRRKVGGKRGRNSGKVSQHGKKS